MEVLLQGIDVIYTEKPRSRRRAWAGTGLTVHSFNHWRMT